MKLTTLITLLAFQSTTTVVAHLLKSQVLLETGVLSAICVLAYTVGAYVLRKDFEKGDVKKGILIGVFMGVFSQICGYYFSQYAGIINVGFILVCLFPHQLTAVFLKIVQRKSDVL